MTGPRRPPPQRTVFITGCSNQGLGAGLALELHRRGGHRVLASARDPDKCSDLTAAGIEVLTLDVLDQDSINTCAKQVSDRLDGRLDVLINNAGGGYNMPVSDIDISEAKKLFDLNVWSYVSVTQAMLPLLIASGKHHSASNSNPDSDSDASPYPYAMVVNQASISSISLTPFNSSYHASKAAASMYSAHLRLELDPFNIRVVELRTGSVRTNFHSNRLDPRVLPAGSLYGPIKEEAERTMNGGMFLPSAMPLDQWAREVVDDLLVAGKGGPRPEIWKGRQAGQTWWRWSFGPSVTWWDWGLRESAGLNRLKGILWSRETTSRSA